MGGWYYDCVRCESGLSVEMAGPGIWVLCLVDTCASDVHPVFNPVAPYGYMLPNMYLFITDVANPDSFVLCCRTWIFLDITHFSGDSANHPSGPHGRLAQNTACIRCDSSTACRLCRLEPPTVNLALFF